jgi:hypothetical protein
VGPEELGKFKKFIYLRGSRTRDLPACNIVFYVLRYRAPYLMGSGIASPVIKRQKRETDHYPSSVEVKYGGAILPLLPCLHGRVFK